MIALRFTSTENEENFTSEDQVNKCQFQGLCAYDITEEVLRMENEGYESMEAIEICALRQVKYDNWHASNSNGRYVAMFADFIELERDNRDYLGNRAVIVELTEYIGHGIIDMKSERYKCESFNFVK